MSDNIFDLFTRKKRALPSDPTARKEPYQAFDAGADRQNGFTILYEGGICTEILFYGYVLRVVLADPEHLVICSTEGAYLIDGRHLTPLLKPLKEYTISAIRAYEPLIHLEPVANQPLITGIEYLTNLEWHEMERNRNREHPSEGKENGPGENS
ncbi:MAG: hypothetical protein CL610_18905 [Anaerolineaceae bacterium]|nr:hypothetical protein [Anaerolineaceae bacterium]